MVRDNGYRQLIDNPTTYNNTLDDIHTNIVSVETVSGNLETYFSGHIKSNMDIMPRKIDLQLMS